jgi:hypothetical protein
LRLLRIVTGLPIFASSFLIYKELTRLGIIGRKKKKEKITNVL